MSIRTIGYNNSPVADLGKEKDVLIVSVDGGILLGAVVGAFFYNNQIEQLKYAYWFGAFLAFLAFLVVLLKKTRT